MAFAILGVTIIRGGELFSPGALSAQASGKTLDDYSSHADIPACHTCHAPFWSLTRMDDRCLDCHTDLFQNTQDFHIVMIAEGSQTSCRACHTDHRGSQAELTRFDLGNFPHEKVGYSLRVHRELPDGTLFACSHCHLDGYNTFDRQVCESCHVDLAADFMQAHQSTFGIKCLACHDGLDTYGKEFDHNQTAFRLEGKHAVLDCIACHREAQTIADLQGAPQTCTGCHLSDDAHAGRFGEDCSLCHSTAGWEPASFDHALSAFPLTGAHAQVACTSCHEQDVFEGTPHECIACHTEPDYHLGLFGQDCAACHTTSSWLPAEYDQLHAFPLDHAEEGILSCQTCHPTSLSEYTCYGCHEHSPAGIEEEHTKEGISDLQNCANCHPTGQKEEGEGEDD